ncbi:propionate catabolism operon regulatory protein [Clostridium botulinum C str. Eklund]|nr:propionate catabolism operon regulatory protein [Clostridium botulinum C str. Eklund]NEZ48092.1 sigma-54-dependent Fis family transcriptional regulator [Clostridium botulinum]
MKDIVIIAPFKDLYDLANKIIKEKKYANVQVILGNLSEGLNVAKKVVKKGAKVLVSRGGTYKMISEEVSIPVVEIKMTSFDVLRGFKYILNYNGTIGVIGYSNIIDGCEVIKEVLKVDLVKIEVDESTAEQTVKPYIENGITVFVGDTIGTYVTRKLGCTSYMITSGREAITNAIEEAARILKISISEREKSEKIKTIIDFVQDGIIAINDNEKITIFNRSAQNIFNINGENFIGKDIRKLIKDSKLPKVLKCGKLQLGEVESLGKSKIAVNRIPIIVDKKIIGALATIEDVTYIQDLEKKLRCKLYKKGFIAKYKFQNIIYKNKETEECIKRAKKYSKYDVPILITGPSGVGKELFAQSIHNYSNRSTGPFVAINCAALPPNLIESELFGYVEGAFTGAVKGGKSGIFELAHKGTIFLDEIGELPLEFQGRILRVLQEREVMRIGDDKVIPIDVRIITATNKNLVKMIEEKRFREDLYFRINILMLDIPSLNKRREDIDILIQFFLKKYNHKYNKKVKGLTKESILYLMNYDYKGNVRELESIISRGIILCENEYVSLDEIMTIDEINTINKNNMSYNDTCISNKDMFKSESNKTLDDLEKQYIRHIVSRCNGEITKAAKILNISRSTIWRKLKKD